MKDLGIPANLRESGVPGDAHFEIMAKDAAESPQVATNPVHATEEDMLALLHAAMDG